MSVANDNLPVFNLMWLFDQLEAMGVKYASDPELVEVLACAQQALLDSNRDSISAQQAMADGCGFDESPF